MSIIEKISKNRQDVYCSSSLNDFYNHKEGKLHILSTNNEDSKSNELNLLIDTITTSADKYFQYFKFRINNNHCVLLFSKPVKDDNDFYQKLELTNFPLISDDTKLLYAIREFNKVDANSETSILIYSFKNVTFLDEIDNVPTLIDFSIYFSLNTWPKRIQKIIFFNSTNNVIYLLDARKDMFLKDNDYVMVTKENEYTYSFISYHTKRRGTSWDDDTATKGTFNFINNKWENFNVEEESFKL